VFTLHFGDEMPLEAVTRCWRSTTHGAKAYIVSAKRNSQRPPTASRPESSCESDVGEAVRQALNGTIHHCRMHRRGTLRRGRVAG
jgi:hypothetical protein